MDLNYFRRYISLILEGVSPEMKTLTVEKFVDLLNLCSLYHFKTKIGLPEQYQPGMPLPRQAFELTMKLTDDTLPFKVQLGVTKPSLMINRFGIATIPTDWYYPSIIQYRRQKPDGTYDMREVDILSDLEYAKRLASYIKKPTLKFPVCNFMNRSQVRFAPLMDKVDFSYIKFPRKAFFAYTTEHDFIEYKPDESVQLEWDEMNCIDIMSLMLKRLGVIMGRQDILGFSDQVITAGK